MKKVGLIGPSVSAKMKLAVLLVVLSAITCESLLCYQCASTSIDGKCVVDYQGLLNTSRDRDLYSESPYKVPYYKNCTDSKTTWDRCFIEKMYGENGQLVLYLRGCHDGVTFSKPAQSPKFINLTPNNATTCAMPSKQLVCFSFCQEDFCNGPQYKVDEDKVCLNETEGCGAGTLHGDNWPTSIMLMVYILASLLVHIFVSEFQKL